uniref:Uncharacterized protein n=1 Tax=Oryza punctata TaxID=4537 RepID=A0A0E0JLF0_ORYPU
MGYSSHGINGLQNEVVSVSVTHSFHALPSSFPVGHPLSAHSFPGGPLPSPGCPKPKRKHPQVTRTIRSTLIPQVATAPAQRGQIKTRHNRKAKNTNRHLNVKPPPQRIIVKGTVKGRIVPPATASNLRSQHQQGKQCQNNSSPQLQRDNTPLQQCPQPVSLAPVHKTAINSSNTLRVAPILTSVSPWCESRQNGKQSEHSDGHDLADQIDPTE